MTEGEILTTPRLLLRQPLAVDTDALVEIWTDPDVTRFMGGPREEARLRSNLDESVSAEEAYDLWPLVLLDTGEVIGHCGLLDKEVEGCPEVELIYVLARAAWGSGLGTEIAQGLKRYAFEVRRLQRLIALIEPENAASERVAIKAGMRLEKEVVRPGGAIRRVYAVEAG
jgi:[ribosomal protein S5]-alanine N-acetyltransferase